MIAIAPHIILMINIMLYIILLLGNLFFLMIFLITNIYRLNMNIGVHLIWEKLKNYLYVLIVVGLGLGKIVNQGL